MPAVSLCCRVCATEHPLEAIGTCTRCFGPLDPTYDWDSLRAPRQPRLDRGRARRRSGAMPTCCPVAAPPDARLAPGLTPLLPAPRLAEQVGVRELWLKLDTANPTHSFKDRVVAVAARKAQELGFDTLSCSSTGNLAGAVAARAAAEGLEAAVFVPSDLEPEKLAAAAVYGPRIYAVNGTYDHCSRLSVELSFELPWGFVNVNLRSYYAEGSKTLAYEIAEQLGWETPDAVAIPIASGALFHKVGQGFAELARSASSTVTAPALFGGQAAGCEPGRDRLPRRRAASCRCGRTASRARSRSATPPTATSPLRPRARRGVRSTRCAEDEIGHNMAELAATTGVFGETATGVTLGALKAAVAAGRVGPTVTRRPARHGRRVEDSRPRVPHLRSNHDRGRRRRVRRRGARRLMAGAEPVRQGLGPARRPRRAR